MGGNIPEGFIKMAMYNITQLTGSSGVGDIVSFAIVASGGWLAILFMLSVFFVLLLGLKRWDFIRALVSSSFATFILSGIMAFAGFIPPFWIFVWLTVLIFSTLILYIS